MSTRAWLTNSPRGTAEGDLGAICLRVLAFWGLLSAPLILIAAISLVRLPAYYGFGLAAIGGMVALYAHFLFEGAAVFSAAPEKDMSAGLFRLVEILLYVSFALATICQTHRHAVEWSSVGFVSGGTVAFLQITYVAIATMAGQRVPWSMAVELAVSGLLWWRFLMA
jgi:hypothetical protein